MSKVWCKSRITSSGDVILYVKRFCIPKWFPGSAKLHGNLSSVINREKVKLVKKLSEIEDILYLIQQASKDHRDEKKYVKSKDYGRADETVWYEEDVKFLKTFQEYVKDPGDDWKFMLHPKLLAKYGLGKGKPETKKASYDDIPDNLAGGEGRSITVLGGTSQVAKNTLAHDLGGDDINDFRTPSGKDKSKKSGKGNKSSKQGHWKNRQSGETDDDYQDRIDEGDPDQ